MSLISTPTSPSFVTSVPFLDLVCLGFIAALLLLSLVSLAFVLRLRFYNPSSAAHGRNFNSLWTVRLLLVSLISLWCLSHLLPFLLLPISPIFPLCRLHLVLSLGFLQPGFLITILYLVTVASVDKPQSGAASALAAVLSASLPILLLQILAATYSPRLPAAPVILEESSVVLYGNDSTPLCACPLIGSLVFAAFGVFYLICFLGSCWRAVSVAINKGLQVRICVLALAISISLSTEILFLGLSALWRPGDPRNAAAMLVVFLCALSCAVAGEGMLVIRPIADALAAGGRGCDGQLSVDEQQCQTPEVVVRDTDDGGGG